MTGCIQSQESPRTTWLITYASGSPDITPEILQRYKVECIECYTITWRESKYTLVHLCRSSRIRSSALKRIMAEMKDDHNIKASTIDGYETFSGNSKDASSITEHPGFQRIVQLLNGNRSELRVWMKSGDVLSNKHGILWNFIDTKDPKTMSRSQLIEKITSLERIAQDYKRIQPAHEALLVAFTAQETEINKLREELTKEKSQSNRFYNETQKKIEECGKLTRRLIALGYNPNEAE